MIILRKINFGIDLYYSLQELSSFRLLPKRLIYHLFCIHVKRNSYLLEECELQVFGWHV